MTPNEYQTQAARTLIDAPPRPLTSADHMLVWNAIGLAGEAGEVLQLTSNTYAVALAAEACAVCEAVKKGIFHERGLDRAVTQAHLRAALAAAASLWNSYFWVLNPALEGLVLKELGDVCWYAAALCSKLGFALANMMNGPTAAALAPIFAANITKLQARFPAGWSTVDAAARADEVST